jgi:outer membrane protein TolC
LRDGWNPIDLNSALQLAGVQNPELQLARQRVVEAAAFMQLAAAQFLPSLNGGMNYDNHTGTLQQSNGNILSLNRSAIYVGAGANAVAAGTVNIPGVFLNANITDTLFTTLAARQLVRARSFEVAETANQQFLRVTLAYSELTRAEGMRAIAIQARNEAREVARLTRQYAETGEGRQADADRAATELARRESAILEAEANMLTASAELCRVLNLDPSTRLHPTDAYLVPLPIVPDPTPLCQLIALALLQRPELAARRAMVRQALLALEGAKLLPFSPTVLVGFSSGGFGGGSNLVSPVFGGFGARTDFDAIAYWTLQNLGVGNAARIRGANAQLQISRFQEIAVLNRVRAEVAEAYARSHARYAQISISEAGIRAALQGFREDYDLTRNRGVRSVLPIELLNNFRLLADSRRAYLDSIVDYNRSQFELFVAMGQPPANALAHPVPTEGFGHSNLSGVPSTAAPVSSSSPPLGDASRPRADTVLR